MKKLSPQSIIGQQGVNLVERIVLGMKYAWRTTAVFDVGIDGEIEICDPITGDATNSFIKVQIKSTTLPFQAETADAFEYVCEQKDISYWLRGNAPVVLIVCRPADNEAYWISVKDYFQDTANQKGRKIHFKKQLHRFDENCAVLLRNLALPADSGIYFAPLNTTETLYTNLLKVEKLAPTIYLAETHHRKGRDIWEFFRRIKANAGSEWILHNKMILSFQPLDEYPFNQICDPGTCEQFGVDEWADADDADRRSNFVKLLNSALRERSKLLGLRYHKDHEFYYFPSNRNFKTTHLDYKSIHKETHREVFKQYRSKNDPRRTTYCRHSAFKGYFLRLESGWFLEITPTYHFTSNGFVDYPFREELLSGIKRLERNPAVVGQLLMWVDFLKRPIKSLFSEEYPFLGFGDLETVTIDAGIPDNTWYEAEEGMEKHTLSERDNQPGLFGL